MQAGFAQKLAKLTTKRMDAWMDGRPSGNIWGPGAFMHHAFL